MSYALICNKYVVFNKINIDLNTYVYRYAFVFIYLTQKEAKTNKILLKFDIT